MRRRLPILGHLALAVGLIAPSTPGAAGDSAEGKSKAQLCAVCHGLDGVAMRPDVPNIGGESDLYLTKQLKAFRSGERQQEEMSIVAEELSDEDIADLVAWYSSIEFEVRMPD
jgi:cytochrome c553